MQTAKEIMTTPVVTISASASVAEALEVMVEKHLRGLMVEPDNLDDAYGIVTEADIVYKVAALGKPRNRDHRRRHDQALRRGRSRHDGRGSLPNLRAIPAPPRSRDQAAPYGRDYRDRYLA